MTREQWRATVDRDFATDADRRCHVCDRLIPKGELCELKTVGVNAVSGRLFCLPGCLAEHLEGEGFDEAFIGRAMARASGREG